MSELAEALKDIPSVRELEPYEKFYSRTNQVKLSGFESYKTRNSATYKLISKVSDYIEKDEDSGLYIVELGEVPKGSYETSLKESYKELNKIISESWGIKTVSAKMEYIGVLIRHYDFSSQKNLFFGLFVGGKGYVSTEKTVNKLTLDFLEKNPAILRSKSANIITNILDMGFRVYLKSLTDSFFSGDIVEQVLFKDLLFVKSITSTGYAKGYSVFLKLNGFGVLNIHSKITTLKTDKNIARQMFPAFSGNDNELMVMALKAGSYKKSDGRRFQPIYAFYPAEKAMIDSPPAPLKNKIFNTRIVFLNNLHDTFLDYLNEIAVDYEEELFQPTHTIKAELFSPTKTGVLRREIQEVLQQGVELTFSPHISDEEKQLVRNKFTKVFEEKILGKEVYFGDINTFKEVDYNSPQSNIPRLYINTCNGKEDLSENEAPQSTIVSVVDDERKFFSNTYSAIQSGRPKSSFDKYTQLKMMLWESNRESWFPVQGIDIATILSPSSEDAIEPAIRKTLNELSMKALLGTPFFALNTKIPEYLFGQYAGIYFRNPKGVGVRAGLLIGNVDATGWSNEYWDALQLQYSSKQAGGKQLIQAMKKLARKSKNTVLQELSLRLESFKGASNIFFNDTFLLFDISNKTIIKIASPYSYTPDLLGAFDHNAVNQQVFAMKEGVPWLSRKSQDKYGKQSPPSRSLISHFNLPRYADIAFQIRPYFIRAIYKISTNQAVPKNNRLRDFSAYKINSSGDIEAMENVAESKAFILHHHMLVRNYIKDEAVAKMSLIEKFCRLITSN